MLLCEPNGPTSDADAPLVSVVIPAYNAEAYIREAVDSVLAQTFTDYELIVVNDASTDSTPDILGDYERHERNRGLSAARNSGILNARGKYVTFLDSDDLWRPEKLEYQISTLNHNPDVMLLSNGEMIWDDGEKVVFPPLPARPRLHNQNWLPLVLGKSPFSASNAIVAREAFAEVGLFDERLRAAEDRDLWMRIVQRFGGIVASGIVDAYRRHSGNMSADPEHMKPNMKFVLRKAVRSASCSLSLRARAYAHLYLDIAIVCYEANKILQGYEHLVKSFLSWPLPLGREVHKTRMVRWIWAIKIAFGKDTFEKVWDSIRGFWQRPFTADDILRTARSTHAHDC